MHFVLSMTACLTCRFKAHGRTAQFGVTVSNFSLHSYTSVLMLDRSLSHNVITSSSGFSSKSHPCSARILATSVAATSATDAFVRQLPSFLSPITIVEPLVIENKSATGSKNRTLGWTCFIWIDVTSRLLKNVSSPSFLISSCWRSYQLSKPAA